MKITLTILMLFLTLWAAPSDSLKAGKKYRALVCLSLRKGPAVDAEKIDVIPLLDEVLFTGARKGELETALFGKSVTDSFVQVVHGSDTGWVFGAMIGSEWDYQSEILSSLDQLVSLGDSLGAVKRVLAQSEWVSHDETLQDFDAGHLWQKWFGCSKSVVVVLQDSVVSSKRITLSYGSRTPRSYQVDLETYLNSPDLEEVCTTTIDLGDFEVPDGCYLKGLNE